MIRIFTVILFSLFFTATNAQPPLAWAQRYNGPADNADEAVALAVDNAGNVYVAGSAFNSTGTMDMVTIKYDASGQQLWVQSYNGTGNDNDEARDIAVDNAGNVYVTGYSKNTTDQDITTIKYNTSGVQQWIAFYNGPFSNYDQGNALTIDAIGNVYVCGYETTSNYTFDFVTIKYDALGNQTWAQTYDGPGMFNDEAKDIALDASGNVYVTGASDTFYNSQPNEDIVLLKYSNGGGFQWRYVYDSPGHGYEYSKKVAVDGNNDIVVAGYGYPAGNGYDYYVIKVNSSGSGLWFQNYNSGPNIFEQPHDLVIDSLDNIILTGQAIQLNNNNLNDYETVKYNSAGTFQWAQRYNGTGNNEDKAYGVALDDSLCIYVTGISKGSGTLMDVATVKYDAAGNQKYVLRWNGQANKDDNGNDIVVKNGDIYVTGKSANVANDDFITLRYSYSAVGMSEQTMGTTSLDVYPNPSNGEVRVIVPSDPASTGNYKVEIVNLVGQTVYAAPSVMSESTGAQSVLTIPAGPLEAGTYFVRIYNGETPVGSAKFIAE